MSAPHCPVTVLVVRHAETTHDRPDAPSDEGGRLTEIGTAQAERLATALRTRRVAAVYTSALPPAQETGTILADRLGVRCTALPGPECRAGEDAGRPDGESARQVGERFRAALEEVADQHRGETVVVVSYGAAMASALPSLCGNSDPALAHWPPPCAVAAVSIDSDGWRLGHWPGSTDPLVAESVS